MNGFELIPQVASIKMKLEYLLETFRESPAKIAIREHMSNSALATHQKVVKFVQRVQTKHGMPDLGLASAWTTTTVRTDLVNVKFVPKKDCCVLGTLSKYFQAFTGSGVPQT